MSTTLADLFVQINARLVEVTSEKLSYEERLKVFAAELGCELGYCTLPGCGRPFVKTHPDQKFCPGSGHKKLFANKYRRSGN